MIGAISTIDDNGGVILSETSAQCPYTFERAQFYGDYDDLKTDVQGGAEVRVVFHTKPGNVAEVVRRLS